MLSDEESVKSSFSNSLLTFSALKGNDELKILLIMLAVDPSIPGLIIFGETGSGKSQFLRAFEKLKIPMQVIANCPYNCSKALNNLCETCLQKEKISEQFNVVDSYSPIIKIPSSISIDALIGSLDLSIKFRVGILGLVNNGYLLIDDLHLIQPHTLNIILSTWYNGKNIVQRQHISKIHPSKFCLLASTNPSIHEISPAILDKFAFSYYLSYEDDIQERIDILELNLDDKIDVSIIKKKTASSIEINKIQQSILEARKNLTSVRITHECLNLISEICLKSGVQGNRADIALASGARALASFLGRTAVIKEDILFLSSFVLKHRLPEDRAEIINDLINDHITGLAKKNNTSPDKNEENKKESKKPPLVDEKPKRSRKIFERIASILGLLIITFSISFLLVKLLYAPEIYLYFLQIIFIFIIAFFLIKRRISYYQNLKSQYLRKEDEKTPKPDISSFANVKQLKLTSMTKEDNREFSKEPVFDLEEDRSKRAKILRFLGLKQRKGLISLSERQRFFISLFGILILIGTFIIFIYMILIFPPQVWVYMLLFIMSLVLIGYLGQSFRSHWHIKRAADIGASPEEKSKRISGEGIGSHVSPILKTEKSPTRSDEYSKNLWNKFKDLNLVSNDSKKETGIRLIPTSSKSKITPKPTKIIADFLPQARSKIDSKVRSRVGKRALSITSLQTGRVIGHQPFKDYPRNVHILATIRNAVIRNYRNDILRSKEGISIELNDIREKSFCSRVSATLIFVLDLSESIVNVVGTVASSVNWLSRQAYLYRDRVGIVVLKGTQGVVVQSPTSNLNLIKRKIRDLRVSGSTPLAGGLQKAIELIKLDRIRSKNEVIPMIILITDGATNIPLLTDPKTGIARNIPLTELGLESAVKLSVQDCITLAHQIKKEKISFTIFSTNVKGARLFARIQRDEHQSILNFLDSFISKSELSGGQNFIQIWSYALLRALQEITSGYFYHLSWSPLKTSTLDTLRIARAEILDSITSQH